MDNEEKKEGVEQPALISDPPAVIKVRKPRGPVPAWTKKCAKCKKPHVHAKGLAQFKRGKPVCYRCALKESLRMVNEGIKQLLTMLKDY